MKKTVKNFEEWQRDCYWDSLNTWQSTRCIYTIREK